MNNTFLIITTIANKYNRVLNAIVQDLRKTEISFIIVGDKKSPRDFKLPGTEYYSVRKQESLEFNLTRSLPYNHYARKNIGYLVAISKGAKIIIETDDDNIPLPAFWKNRSKKAKGQLIEKNGWTNVYKYFTNKNIWPRGFSLENINDTLPMLSNEVELNCPIQQGLADGNPDVDAIYRLTLTLPIQFNKTKNIILGYKTICPFNSQNTTWFKDAFPLLYLPSYCSFRMTDIWRSFVAQRIAWTCGWNILFHQSTVKQERNDHNLMKDFNDEIVGYQFNSQIMKELINLDLKKGKEHINENLILCYNKLIELNLVHKDELDLVKNWIKDINNLLF